jgi:tetratricopeptide (TPR) repeat protein
MAGSEFLIVLCSPRAAASQWVNREVAWFKTHREAQKILTLIVEGEPGASAMPGRETEECFPKTLLYKVDANLQATDEFEDAPLAADARDTGDGRRGAKLKIAAAMLGVGLDTLVNRDNRRRAQRRQLVYAGLASLSLVLSGLTAFAFMQRNEAVAAKNDAEFQKSEAQDLVEFMLTDLRQRLDAVGRLDILDSVAKRLLESYDKQDLATLDPDALGRRARVQLLLGEVDNTRGNLDAALARYKEAAATTEELLRRDPDDQQRIFDHAQSVYWVGDIALKRGDMATVTDYWTQYRDFGLRLVELDPDKDEWRTELAYGHRNLASLALDEGDLKAAEAGFRRALEISAALAARHPDDKETQIALAQDYAWLAEAEERLGAFAAAEQSNAREAAIYAALLATDAEDDSILRQQSVNGRVRARIVMASGDAARAREILLALVPLHEDRLAREPKNSRWLDYYGLLQIDIGAAELTLGDAEAGHLAAVAALGLAERLLALDPSSIEWATTNRWRALLLAVRCVLESGELATAARYLAQAEMLAANLSITQNDLLIDKLAVRTNFLNAKLAELSGDHVEANRIAVRLIESVMRFLPKSGFENRMDFLDTLMLAGETVKAAAIANDLETAGYRHPDFIRLKEQLATLEGRERASQSD